MMKLDLHDALRSRTAALHERLEKQPYFSALHAGSLPAAAVVSFLRCLSVLHAILERSLSQLSDRRLSALSDLTLPKMPLLTADLAALDAWGVPSIDPAMQAALEMGAGILQNAELPLTLIGTLYVLEGSQNGGAILKKAYARCLNVEPDRLSYFGCYGNKTAESWRGFVQALGSIKLNERESEIACASAVACFEGIEKICAALYPFSEADLRFHSTGINPEAGDHAIPQDPIRIALALRAGREAWKAFPYLEARFGERGKRFTSSDSCWLVALTQLPAETVTARLRWLRALLVKRGIPTIILEGHLQEISRALQRELPAGDDESKRYAPFLSRLESERHAIDPDGILREVGDWYEKRFHEARGRQVAGAARLISSAWIDERSGIQGALGAVQDWFSDPKRFSEEWIVTVSELIASLEKLGEKLC